MVLMAQSKIVGNFRMLILVLIRKHDFILMTFSAIKQIYINSLC
jgi:hypothetical protein